MTTLGCYGLLADGLDHAAESAAVVDGKRAVKRKRKPQFGILSISVLTTGVAIVMVAANRYAQQIGNDFLTQIILVMASLLLTSLVAIATSTSKINLVTGAFVVISVSLVSAALMVFIDDNHNPGSSPASATPLVLSYCEIVSTLDSRHPFGRCGMAEHPQVILRALGN